MLKDKYKFSKIISLYEEAKVERYDYFSEWRNISKFLVPGRGVYTDLTRSTKKITNRAIINNMAEDALYTLTAGMHGGLTSPSLKWFDLEWTDENLTKIFQLQKWIQDVSWLIHTNLQRSNFYSVINSFYVEVAAFGTGCMYVGSDSDTDDTFLRFEMLTVGEYCFTCNAAGLVDQFWRVMYMSPKQIVDRWGDKAPKEYHEMIKENNPSQNTIDRTVIEYITKEKYLGKDYIRICYDTGHTEEALEMSSYYEMPYKIARWNTIGSDTYGSGPGSRALSDIRKLQQIEKSRLTALHKTIDPPLAVPAHLKNKINSLPGGYNYMSGPNDRIEQLYRINYNFAGVNDAIQSIEYRLQKTFYNDIFITVDRAGGKSPLKAAEVQARESEKLLRLGPVIERLQHEFLAPLVERVFNILLRLGELPALQPELQQMVGDYKISLISPLATAQRGVALQSINSFLTFVGSTAQFDQRALDKINIDATVDTYANITGVDKAILNDDKKVKQLRQQREQAIAQQQQAEANAQQVAAAESASKVDKSQAEAQRIQSEAALNQANLNEQFLETGVV